MYDGRSHADVDAAIVMDHMVLAAADLALGTCSDARWTSSSATSAGRPGNGGDDAVLVVVGGRLPRGLPQLAVRTRVGVRGRAVGVCIHGEEGECVSGINTRK